MNTEDLISIFLSFKDYLKEKIKREEEIVEGVERLYQEALDRLTGTRMPKQKENLLELIDLLAEQKYDHQDLYYELLDEYERIYK